MQYAKRTERIGGDGANAWAIHERALERAHQGLPVTILSVGDPDFDTPKAITEAAVASLRAGDTHYAPIQGIPELRQAIADHHSRTSGQPVAASQVTVLAGAQCGLFCAAQCLFNPGDEVIIPEPMYVTYEAVFGAVGAKVVSVPGRAEDGFHPRLEDLSAAITSKTKAIFLNSPNNPSGACLGRAFLEGLAGLCTDHDLWLISDEVYANLTYDADHISPCDLPGMAERTVTVSSLSKSHAMTGWRLGWLVGPQELSDHVGNLALSMLYGCPSFVQKAAVTALTGDQGEVKAMKADYLARREAVYEVLSACPVLEVTRPQAGMFFLVDVRPTGLSCQAFAEALFEAHHIAVLPAAAFGASARGHLRLSLSYPAAQMREICQTIAQFAEGIAR